MLHSFTTALLLVVPVAIISCQAISDENFDEFVLEIEEFINASTTYVWPTSNEAYFSSEDAAPVDYGSYDFIIVGGGTAGGILANRLTEQENFTVLLVEAGGAKTAISDVLGLNSYLLRSEWNWGYNTTRQTNGCLGSADQRCAFARGKGLGGCSSINEGFVSRGNQRDFEQWAELGNSGWSYEDCLPYFKKSERVEFSVNSTDATFRGFDGPQSVNIPEDSPILTETFINAFKELGNTYVDYNGASQYGVSRPQYFLDNNTRASTAHSYIYPILNRTNLVISIESLVSKVDISNNTATGIEFWKNGTKYTASAKKEVILSAGTINSPQLLMLSGVGPAEELTKHGIEVIADLPVGKNFQDKFIYPGIYYRTNYTLYNNTLLENLALWRENHRPLTAGYGIQAVNYYNSEGNNELLPEVEICVLGQPSASPSAGQFLIYNEEYQDSLNILDSATDIGLSLILLHPQTTGKITLKSNSPKDYPVIDMDYFGNPEDLEVMYNATQYATQLNETTAFQSLGAYQIFPALPDCDPYYEKLSKDWWICGIKYTGSSAIQAIGTTSMGLNSTTSVVDPNLKVHGIENLRVVDAGILPNGTSGHLNVVVAMVAEKAADIIKSEYN